MKFRITGGPHFHAGHGYVKGDVLESSQDLCEIWPNKMERVSDDTPVTSPTNPGVHPSISLKQPAKELPPSQQPPAAAQKAAISDDGVDDEVEEGKEVGAGPITTQKPAQAAGQAATTAPAAPKGRDVTATFPKAQEEDYKVFKSEGQYFVYDADTLQPINAEGVGKKEVEGVIDKALSKG